MFSLKLGDSGIILLL